jgi:hypothetical protein
MNKLKVGFIFLQLIVGTIIMFLIVIVIVVADSKIKSVENEYKSHIGKSYMFDRDTIKVVDYSMMEKSYTLDNGLSVSKDFINQCKLLK